MKKLALLLPSLRSRTSFFWIFDDMQSDGFGTTPPGRRALTLRLSLDYGRSTPQTASELWEDFCVPLPSSNGDLTCSPALFRTLPSSCGFWGSVLFFDHA